MKTLPLLPVSLALAVFLAVAFALDYVVGALLPNWWVMHETWELFLPDFTFGSLGGFVIGLVEAFVGGFLTGVLFVPIWNAFASRRPAS